jgi:hypothetical protein
MIENGVGEKMKRMRKEWNERRKREKDCGRRDKEGIELTCSSNEKEMFGKEDIANVIFIEWQLIPDEEKKKWAESEKIVDVIESVILEKEKEKEDLREKDCVTGNYLLCDILCDLIRSSSMSVESVVCLSQRMLLQQISLLCSDPHSSFTREQCFYLIDFLVEKGTNESIKLMHSMGLLKCVEERMSEKKERNMEVLYWAIDSLFNLLKKRREERKKKAKEEGEKEMWKDILGSFECDGLEETVCAGKCHIDEDIVPLHLHLGVAAKYSHVGENLGLWKREEDDEMER